MSIVSLVLRLGALATVAATASGCIIVDDRHDHYRGDDGAAYAPPPSGTPSGGTTAGPIAPMLVEVDADQTMTADPGRGVGVFVEYGSGGQWHVWWTCDTLLTNKSCDVSLSITSGNGPVANLDTTQLPGGYTATPDATRVDASIRTTTEVHGLRFETLPGAPITVDANISGLRDGSFLFFVQDGKVRGGFAGQVTNPLQLQGKTP